MEDKYYVYSGEISQFDDADFFKKFFGDTYILGLVQERVQDILSDDERIELKHEAKFNHSKRQIPGMCYYIIPTYSHNIYINLKASTIALIALILDIEATNGIASFILAATGVNIRLITKLNEETGEKCVLVEVYKKENHKAKSDIFNQIYGKECINNDMNCKYRVQGICTIDQEKVKEILDNLNDKNVLTKKNDFYKYNF